MRAILQFYLLKKHDYSIENRCSNTERELIQRLFSTVSFAVYVLVCIFLVASKRIEAIRKVFQKGLNGVQSFASRNSNGPSCSLVELNFVKVPIYRIIVSSLE